MKTGIIIINYKGEEDTKACLKSIEEFYSKQNNWIIFLIDNDTSNYFNETYLKNLNLNIFLIKNIENKGFAEGNNIGIRQALKMGCDYIALINNDTEFIDNSLLKAVESLDKNHDLGIVGLINYYYKNPEKIWQAGFKSNLNIGRTHSVNILKDRGKRGVVFVDYVPGSSIIIKSDVFDKTGLLDSQYFAYYEEYDFCIRAKSAGYKIGILCRSKILHKVGKSSTSAVKLYLRTRNKLLLYKKHANHLGFWIAFIQHIGISTYRIIFLEKNKLKLFRAMFLGIKDYNNNIFYYGSLNKIN